MKFSELVKTNESKSNPMHASVDRSSEAATPEVNASNVEIDDEDILSFTPIDELSDADMDELTLTMEENEYEMYAIQGQIERLYDQVENLQGATDIEPAHQRAIEIQINSLTPYLSDENIAKRDAIMASEGDPLVVTMESAVFSMNVLVPAIIGAAAALSLMWNYIRTNYSDKFLKWNDRKVESASNKIRELDTVDRDEATRRINNVWINNNSASNREVRANRLMARFYSLSGPRALTIRDINDGRLSAGMIPLLLNIANDLAREVEPILTKLVRNSMHPETIDASADLQRVDEIVASHVAKFASYGTPVSATTATNLLEIHVADMSDIHAFGLIKDTAICVFMKTVRGGTITRTIRGSNAGCTFSPLDISTAVMRSRDSNQAGRLASAFATMGKRDAISNGLRALSKEVETKGVADASNTRAASTAITKVQAAVTAMDRVIVQLTNEYSGKITNIIIGMANAVVNAATDSGQFHPNNFSMFISRLED